MDKTSTNKTKVAIIGLKGLPSNSGAAAAMEGVIDELKENYEITVYSVNSHTSINGMWNGFEQITFSRAFHPVFSFLFYFLKSALHCLFIRKYDCIHVHHLAGAFIVPILRLRYKHVICSVHALPEQYRKWKYVPNFVYTFLKFCFAKFASDLTTVNKYDAVAFKPFTNKMVEYIPNGIPKLPTNTSENLKTFDFIVAAGRIIPTKGFHIFLEANKLLDQSYHLMALGDINQLPTYKKLLLDLATGLDIEFGGLIKDKAVLLQKVKQAHFFVFPSTIEGMSMMLLEAAYTQTPIIASDIPANRAVFDDDEVLFFETKNPHDLANKMQYALSNRHNMEMRAAKAYVKLNQEFNVKNIAPQYAKLYDKASKYLKVI